MSKLFWRYGSMASGKSLALLGVAHNYERTGQKAHIYTTAMDNRFGEGVVASRIGISRPAELFTKDTVFSVESLPEGTVCVLVDESQFCTKEQIKQLHKIAALGNIPVIAFGLRSDYRGDGFEGSMALGIYADEITELKSVCDCGKKASFNMRVDSDGNRVREGEQVVIGDACYVQKCPVCFLS
jgi:thymidine kinase